MVKNPFRKAFRKSTHNIGRALKKRYTKKGNLYKGLTLNYKTIMKDVQNLKNLINTEKKRLDLSGNSIQIGHMNQALTGTAYAAYQLIDITPIPSEGITIINNYTISILLFLVFYFINNIIHMLCL